MSADLIELVQSLGQPRVLVVGDVMLDRYWYGDASRISPEAPVPVLLWRSEEELPGGAANVARNCAALARNPRKFMVQKGATRQEAETKALGKCGRDCEVAAWTCTK